MTKKIIGNKPYKGPAGSRPKPIKVIPEGPIPHERKPKPKVRVVKAGVDGVLTDWEQAKAEAIAAKPGMRLVKVQTKRVRGRPMRKAKPFVDEARGDHSLILKRIFIFQ